VHNCNDERNLPSGRPGAPVGTKSSISPYNGTPEVCPFFGKPYLLLLTQYRHSEDRSEKLKPHTFNKKYETSHWSWSYMLKLKLKFFHLSRIFRFFLDFTKTQLEKGKQVLFIWLLFFLHAMRPMKSHWNIKIRWWKVIGAVSKWNRRAILVPRGALVRPGAPVCPE